MRHKFLMKNFKVMLQVQLNKDVKNPSQPTTIKHPLIKAKIVIGEENQLGNCDQVDDQNSLRFSLYQPQILKILRVLEIIGFFNEFKEGALAKFYQNNFTSEEALEYEKMYSKWRALEESQKDVASEIRAKMKGLEEDRDYEKIIEIRQKGVNKLKSRETKENDMAAL